MLRNAFINLESIKKKSTRIREIVFKHITYNKLRILLIIFSLAYFANSILQSLKIGAFWDSKADYDLSMVNSSWIRNGIPVTEEATFSLMRSYSWTLFYFSEIPKFILSYFFGKSWYFNSENWMTYRNVFTFFIYLIGLWGLWKWFSDFKDNEKIIAGVLLLCFPVTFGYGFFDEKDVPIFTAVSLSLASIKLLKSSFLRSGFVSKIHQFVIGFCVVLFSVGVRPSSFVIVLPIVAFFCISGVQQKTVRKLLPYFLGMIMSLVIVYLSNAMARFDGFYWLWRSYQDSSAFTPWRGGLMLSWGTLFPAGETRLYPILVLLSQIPDWAVVVFISQILLFGNYVRGTSKKHKFSGVNLEKLTSLLPSILLLITLAYTIILKPVLYDDVRQILFIWVFIEISIIQILLVTYRKLRKKTTKIFFVWCIIISVTFTFLDKTLLTPYFYVYKNSVANLISPEGFERDYWGLSGRELISNSKLDSPTNDVISVYAQPPDSFIPFLGEGIQLSDSATPDYFATISRPSNLGDSYKNCPIVASVERKQVFSKPLVLSYVRKCAP